MIARIALATLLGGFVSTALCAESRTFSVPSFDEVSVSANISAIIDVGKDTAVTADAANSAILDRLQVEVRGKRLEIGYRADFFDWVFNFGQNKGVVVHVFAPSVVSVEANSGADVDANGMTGDALTLASSSGASLAAKAVSGSRVSVETSSGAGLTIEGSCMQLIAEASSGANADASHLACEDVDAGASSGAHVGILAMKSIDAEASSGGSVQIFGKAPDVKVDTSSGGSITYSN